MNPPRTKCSEGKDDSLTGLTVSSRICRRTNHHALHHCLQVPPHTHVGAPSASQLVAHPTWFCAVRGFASCGDWNIHLPNHDAFCLDSWLFRFCKPFCTSSVSVKGMLFVSWSLWIVNSVYAATQSRFCGRFCVGCRHSAHSWHILAGATGAQAVVAGRVRWRLSPAVAGMARLGGVEIEAYFSVDILVWRTVVLTP